MSAEVQFDEDNNFGSSSNSNPSTGSFGGPVYHTPGIPSTGFQGYNNPVPSNEPKMVQWLIRHNWVSSPKGANAVLLVIVAINILIMFVLIKYFL